MKMSRVASLLCLLMAVSACQPSRVEITNSSAPKAVKLQPSTGSDEPTLSLTARAMQAHKELKKAYDGLNYETEKDEVVRRGAIDSAAVVGGAAVVSLEQTRINAIQKGIARKALMSKSLNGVSYADIFDSIVEARKANPERYNGQLIGVHEVQQKFMTAANAANAAVPRAEEAESAAKEIAKIVKGTELRPTMMEKMKDLSVAAQQKAASMVQAFNDFRTAPSAKSIGGNVVKPTYRQSLRIASRNTMNTLFGNLSTPEGRMTNAGRLKLIGWGLIAAGAVDAYVNTYSQAKDYLKAFSSNDEEGMIAWYMNTPIGNAALVAMSAEEFADLANENPQLAQFTIDLNEKLQAAGTVQFE